MKFLVDAHLPAGLVGLLRASGYDVIHTSQLPAKNVTTDAVINQVSLLEERVVISKDTDFYYSLLLQQRPYKLLLVRTGNLRARDLIALFERHLGEIVRALESHSLVELQRTEVRVVV